MEAIYSETDPIIWLPVETYRTARRAKQVAWRGDDLPHCFAEDLVRLKDLKVSRVFMINEGEKHGYDEWWSEVDPEHVLDPHGILQLTEFFRVEPA